ncbi:MAG: Nif3-like dinuclear metal center hexameric protein [Cytophagaceae bacterium]
MQISEIVRYLDQAIPKALQEDYDNVGLLVGNTSSACTGILTTLDVTEEVLDEAIQKGCNLIVSHHPVIFKGLKQLTGKNYVERIVIKAIQHQIALYAMHTNLDNHPEGVNLRLAQILGLHSIQILQPKSLVLGKLVVFVPIHSTEIVKEALFKAGAGTVGNYDECSFQVTGTGEFKGNDQSNPTVGEPGVRESTDENRLEVIYPLYLESSIVKALLQAHPYEEVAYDLIPLRNSWTQVGSGAVGLLPEEMEVEQFLSYVGQKMDINNIRFTTGFTGKVKKVAVCGGVGSFLIKSALYSGAQAFITSDVKYHEFFDAENKLLVADIGHYETEKHTKALIKDILTKKFTNIAVYLSEKITNPIGYFTL